MYLFFIGFPPCLCLSLSPTLPVSYLYYTIWFLFFFICHLYLSIFLSLYLRVGVSFSICLSLCLLLLSLKILCFCLCRPPLVFNKFTNFNISTLTCLSSPPVLKEWSSKQVHNRPTLLYVQFTLVSLNLFSHSLIFSITIYTELYSQCVYLCFFFICVLPTLSSFGSFSGSLFFFRLMCLVLQITLPLSFCLTDSQFLCLFLGLTLSLSYRLSVL